MVGRVATQQAQAPIVTAQVAHFGAPTGGWNSYDNITAMEPQDAVQLDNVFPETTYVRLRRGSTLWGQYNPAPAPIPNLPVETLMVYASGANTQKLLGAVSNVIFDYSVPGAPVIVTGASGMTSAVWQWTNFATPGGQYLVCVNGSDQYQWIYNGSSIVAGSNTWATGVTAAQFSTICAYNQRLFFGSDSSLNLYYLHDVQTYQGEIEAMDVGSFCPLGGAIADLGTWTRDNGFGGVDDLLVVVTTMGEAVLFQGINPDDPNQWTMLGRFVIGKPVGGHRALARLGPDMVLLCEDGFQPLTKYLAMGESQAREIAISRKIGNAVSQAVKLGRALFGWEALLYPANNALIVNVPQAGGGFQQYVVNTITGAWCRFLGLNAYTWAIYQDLIFFGTDLCAVIQADNGTTDQGTPISFEIVTSFQVLGNLAQQKRATMCRPFLIADGPCKPLMDVNVDYNISTVASQIVSSTAETMWNEFDWDQANWGTASLVQNNWFSVQGIGTSFAVHMSGAAQAMTLQLLAFDLTYEPGMGFI